MKSTKILLLILSLNLIWCIHCIDTTKSTIYDHLWKTHEQLEDEITPIQQMSDFEHAVKKLFYPREVVLEDLNLERRAKILEAKKLKKERLIRIGEQTERRQKQEQEEKLKQEEQLRLKQNFEREEREKKMKDEAGEISKWGEITEALSQPTQAPFVPVSQLPPLGLTTDITKIQIPRYGGRPLQSILSNKPE